MKELAELSPARQAVFALAAATRQLGSFERVAQRLQWVHANQPREIAVRLWEHVKSGGIALNELREHEALVLGWIPDSEQDDWVFEFAFVQEALSSLIYAMRSLLTANPEEGGWAARAAYNSADQASIRLLAVKDFSPEVELALLSHPIVQRELARQAQALDILRVGTIAELQVAAFAQDLLTDEEFELVARSKALE